MSRKTLIKTVSIPVELQEFLNENPELSLSKICQSKIIEIRANREHNFNAQKEILKIKGLLQNSYQFIADNKLWEKFAIFRG